MFSKSSKKPQLDQDQIAQFEYASKRIRQKKRLFAHFVVFLIGSLLMVILNKGLGYGEEFMTDWFVWVILAWFCLLLYHAATVFITSKFMDKEWESKQLENLKAKQEAKLAELAASIDTGAPSPDKGNRSNTVTMIAAAGANNELGKDNDLVWHLPVDFKRFKTLTTGHHIIMGRKTFESFPKLLPNRIHVVITRNPEYKNSNCIIVNSVEQALEVSAHDANPFIIGGGEIYKQAIPHADKIELTRVHGAFEADTFFPEIDERIWKLVNSEKHPKDEKHAYEFVFETYLRK
ncbi:dihydrofolate reductase [Gilvibacter sp.]|uniref:dihydrofolate reductase n=1 Tax=Gilvibacter sp. TaxID=2729997 RepID=UPI0025C64B41|nr:dihydrofolate reductase [Gilvibacter sp.]NQX76345.1 dihydrofolate reductase [Gilvibacter sp.]